MLKFTIFGSAVIKPYLKCNFMGNYSFVAECSRVNKPSQRWPNLSNFWVKASLELDKDPFQSFSDTHLLVKETMSVKQTSGFDLFLSYTKIIRNNDFFLKIGPSEGWVLSHQTAFGTALIIPPYIDNLFSKAQKVARQKKHNPDTLYGLQWTCVLI